MEFEETPKVLARYFSEEEIVHLINMNDIVSKCEILVDRLLTNGCNKEGLDHLYRVAQKQLNRTDKAAALLHDTIEGMNVEILRYLRISEEVIEIVQLINEIENLSYDQKISRIIASGHQGAMNIVYADILDNIDPERLKCLEESDQLRLTEKYEAPLIRLRRAFKID